MPLTASLRKLLAYVLGDRKDEAFLRLKEFLEPFGITLFYPDDWGAYKRHIEAEKHVIGKENTQRIERKNLTFTTEAFPPRGVEREARFYGQALLVKKVLRQHSGVG